MAYNSISIKPYIKSHIELQREITLIESTSSPYFIVLSICLAYMNMLQGLMKIQQWLFKILRKQNVTYGCKDAWTDIQSENSIPTINKVWGGGGGEGGRMQGRMDGHTKWKQYTHHKQSLRGGGGGGEGCRDGWTDIQSENSIPTINKVCGGEGGGGGGYKKFTD